MWYLKKKKKKGTGLGLPCLITLGIYAGSCLDELCLHLSLSYRVLFCQLSFLKWKVESYIHGEREAGDQNL